MFAPRDLLRNAGNVEAVIAMKGKVFKGQRFGVEVCGKGNGLSRTGEKEFSPWHSGPLNSARQIVLSLVSFARSGRQIENVQALLFDNALGEKKRHKSRHDCGGYLRYRVHC